MKYKITMVSIFLVLELFLMTWMKEKYQDHQTRSEIAFDYYLADNQAKLWSTYTSGGSLPEYNTLPPSKVDFDEVVEKSSLIKGVVPYYPMGFGIDRLSSKVTFTSEVGSKDVLFPYKVSDSLTYQNMLLTPYTDEDVFLSATSVTLLDDGDDGVYITKNILKSLKLDRSENLQITGTLYVPTKGQCMTEMLSNFREPMESYQVSEYTSMECTLPIKGVIDESSQEFSYLDTAFIVLPYQLMDKLYKQATELADEVTWEPNTYIIQLNQRCDPKTLSMELSPYMNDFILLGVPYGDYRDLYLYQAGDGE